MRDLTALRFTVSTALCALLLVGIAIFSGASQATSASPISHVVIVIVDGLRPDAIFEARAPNLQALTRRGAYCVRARTVVPAATLPAHVSMLTGLGPTRHAVRFNTYPGHYYPEATLFSIAKKAGLTTAFLFAKRKLTFLADPRHLDVVYGPVPGSLDETRVTAARLSAVFDERWSQHQYNLAVVHIREPDDAGHHYGWMS
ncbi:MAG: alkaline phosphatase family protein, partial [Acidiferrobacterales bacterium]